MANHWIRIPPIPTGGGSVNSVGATAPAASTGGSDPVISIAVPMGNTAYVDSIIGNDLTAQVGDMILPFATIGAAEAAITTASNTNPFLIIIGPGSFDCTSLVKKSNISWMGQGISTTFISTTSGDVDFYDSALGAGISSMTITGCTFTCGLVGDWSSGLLTGSKTISLVSCQITGTFVMTQDSNAGASLNIIATNMNAGFSIYNGYIIMVGCVIAGNYDAGNSANHSSLVYFNGVSSLNDVVINQNTGGTTLFLCSGSLSSYLTLNDAGSGGLTALIPTGISVNPIVTTGIPNLVYSAKATELDYASVCGSGTLGVGGTLTVGAPAIKATSKVYVTSRGDLGTPGFLTVGNIVASTSFDVTSSNAADLSNFDWFIIV